MKAPRTRTFGRRNARSGTTPLSGSRLPTPCLTDRSERYRPHQPDIWTLIHFTASDVEPTAFAQACQRLGVRQSMGRPGLALDNAVIGSWHSTLEFELRSVEQFATRAASQVRVAARITTTTGGIRPVR
jgi:transposase InsO family protein